jgi:hypothetical protein
MDDPGYPIALIRHRIPELDAGTLSLIEATLAGDMVPAETLERVLDEIDALKQRIDAIAEAA